MTEKLNNQETENIRLVPPITPELLEKNEEFQQQIREGLNATIVPPQVAQRARQLLVVEETKAVMRVLQASYEKATERNDSESAGEFNRQLETLSENLAAALFEVGEFAAAASATNKTRKKEYYASFARAVEQDDEAHCEHAKYIEQGGQTLPNYFRERDVYSAKHNRIVSVIKCNECDFRNVKPLPEDLAEASRKRHEFIKQNAET